MKKILMLVAIVLSMSATELKINKGWNLIGFSNSISARQLQNGFVKYIFRYTDGKWKEYDLNSNYDNDNTNENEGFWIYSVEESTIVVHEDDYKRDLELCDNQLRLLISESK